MRFAGQWPVLGRLRVFRASWRCVEMPGWARLPPREPTSWGRTVMMEFQLKSTTTWPGVRVFLSWLMLGSPLGMKRKTIIDNLARVFNPPPSAKLRLNIHFFAWGFLIVLVTRATQAMEQSNHHSPCLPWSVGMVGWKYAFPEEVIWRVDLNSFFYFKSDTYNHFCYDNWFKMPFHRDWRTFCTNIQLNLDFPRELTQLTAMS